MNFGGEICMYLQLISTFETAKNLRYPFHICNAAQLFTNGRPVIFMHFPLVKHNSGKMELNLFLPEAGTKKAGRGCGLAR
jgi:hypothetical protein